jgi:subtilisin family serine protease
MPTHPRSDGHTLALTLLAVAVTVVLIVVGGGSSRATTASATPVASSWRGLVGSRPRVAIGQRVIVVLRTPSLAQRVAAAGGRVRDRRERRWSAAVLASQRLLIARMAVQGVAIRPEYTFTRVLNGFSAAIDDAGVARLEQDDDVLGVYPVRPAYLASVATQTLLRPEFGPDGGHRADVGVSGLDGRGVTIALLDTGVDPATPYLRARILRPGIDVVGGSTGALPARKPDEPGQLERHGTQMAGLLVGGGGPAGLAGVAPGATVQPIRVAGWQPDATGRWAVYGRSDQVIAGLERAVDPNDDGDAHDAARIALIALAEPFAAFADGPEARAVAGALALDTLVVTAAGNDGAFGPGFGSIAGPGGAPGALTVGAVDARRSVDAVRVALRSGPRVFLDRPLPLAGVVRPNRLDLEVALPRGTLAQRPRAPGLLDFFTRDGRSLVAGRAALVPGGSSPAPAAARAARAGASAVLLYGVRLPAGSLGLDETVGVPVVSLPTATARALLDEFRAGHGAVVSIGRPRTLVNAEAGRVASFSSTGLAFDGRVKPELVAPGVALATSDVGSDPEGGPRFATVNGSSAAAAVVAGAAALLAQARPALPAPVLKSLLVGTGRPIGATSISAQGNGLVDVGAAVAGELAATPTTLALGRAAGAPWRVRDAFVLQNVSTRTIRGRLRINQTREGASAVRVTLRPTSFALRRGRSVVVTVTAETRSAPLGSDPAEGAVVASVTGGSRIRVPWLIAFGRPDASLLGHVALQRRTFRQSDTAPAPLYLDVGALVAAGGRQELRTVSRLQLELFNAAGDDLGLLAERHDVFGRIGFGLTGRDPDGNVLPPGDYVLRLTAWPTDGGPASRHRLRFRISSG